MKLITNYHGVKIYVTTEGEFYCNIIDSFHLYSRRTHSSFELAALKNNIDTEIVTHEEDGDIYYSFDIWSRKPRKLVVVKKIGSGLYFDTGEYANDTNIRELYPESLLENNTYKNIIDCVNEQTWNDEAILELQAANHKLVDRKRQLFKILEEELMITMSFGSKKK